MDTIAALPRACPGALNLAEAGPSQPLARTIRLRFLRRGRPAPGQIEPTRWIHDTPAVALAKVLGLFPQAMRMALEETPSGELLLQPVWTEAVPSDLDDHGDIDVDDDSAGETDRPITGVVIVSGLEIWEAAQAVVSSLRA